MPHIKTVDDVASLLGDIKTWLNSNGSDIGSRPSEESKAIQVTMPLTPGTVVSIDIPTNATWVQISPQVNPVIFAVDETPVNLLTDNTTSIEVADLGIGNVAKAGETEKRKLKDDASQLNLIASIASVVATIEFIG